MSIPLDKPPQGRQGQRGQEGPQGSGGQPRQASQGPRPGGPPPYQQPGGPPPYQQPGGPPPYQQPGGPPPYQQPGGPPPYQQPGGPPPYQQPGGPPPYQQPGGQPPYRQPGGPPPYQQPGGPPPYQQPGAPAWFFEKLDIGESISTTFSVFKDRFLLLWLITAIGVIPNLLGQLIWDGGFEFYGNGLDDGPASGMTEVFPAGFGALMTMSAILNMVLQGAICYAVYRTLRGEEAEFGDCLGKGLQRLGALFLTGLLLMVGIFVYLIVVTLLIAMGSLIGLPVVIILAVACLFFGAVIAAKVCLALPVCVIEKAGPIQSLSRAFELSRGNLWRILLVLLLFMAMYLVLSGILAVPMSLSLAAGGGAEVLGLIVISAAQCIPFILLMVSLPVLYCQLRSVRENYSIIDEADLFD